jgi:ribose transport system substrate-binding protein
VDEQRDNDYVEKAIQITESWLQAYPDLSGIVCNNMSNPVGACQAIADAGKSGEIIIGGMDHDLRTFNYLADGTLYVAQVQNCYDMGYKMIYNAVMTVDGEQVDEITNVGSTSAYQDEAEKYIDLLYGNK